MQPPPIIVGQLMRDRAEELRADYGRGPRRPRRAGLRVVVGRRLVGLGHRLMGSASPPALVHGRKIA